MTSRLVCARVHRDGRALIAENKFVRVAVRDTEIASRPPTVRLVSVLRVLVVRVVRNDCVVRTTIAMDLVSV